MPFLLRSWSPVARPDVIIESEKRAHLSSIGLVSISPIRHDIQFFTSTFPGSAKSAEMSYVLDELHKHFRRKPKIFRDTTVTNLSEFFERFQRLSICSNEELEQIVQQAKQVIGNVPPQQLRDSVSLRSQINGQLSDVQTTLDRHYAAVVYGSIRFRCISCHSHEDRQTKRRFD